VKVDKLTYTPVMDVVLFWISAIFWLFSATGLSSSMAPSHCSSLPLM